MKKLFCMLLAMMLVLGTVAMAEPVAEFDPDFDIVGEWSQYPVANGDVTIKVMLPVNDATVVEADQKWFWTWWPQASGVNFEVEQVLSSGLGERKNLMFASADLPDLMMDLGLSTNEMMTYGAAEGLLLNTKPYITNAEIMPNLAFLIETYPISLANITAADGNSYTMPWYVNQLGLYGEETRAFIDVARLDALGLEIPKTLDELIDAVYKMKEADPTCIPIGGSMKNSNPSTYLLNAFGFLGNGGNWGLGITVRDGEAVIPAGDPLYKEYLTLMNKFYTDGIIMEDYFTADGTAVNAAMSEGKLGIYPFVPFTVTPNKEDWIHYESIIPLTSEWQEEAEWLAYNQFSGSGLFISAETEYAEIICKLIDFFYSDFGYYYLRQGPLADHPDTLGMWNGWSTGYKKDEAGNTLYNPYGSPITTSVYPDVDSGKYTDNYDAMYHHTPVSFSFGNNGIAAHLSAELGFDVGIATAARFKGLGFQTAEDWNLWKETWKIDFENPKYFDLDTTEGWFRHSMMVNVTPYVTTGFPAIVYYAEEDSLAMNEYQTVLADYIEGEMAKFITGARSLDEFDAYIEEIEALGFREWEQYYKDAYANYLAAMGN